ncbi:sugar ABC transporter substrate-binding protein [Polymorphospora sp. NPDC050346]|uniref:ABC transporter substrate-binding protein n=1 Tax=Polymorphospora sp. NPDC050346 TaxID=3155780 RepID=UPI0033C0F75E
MFRKILAIAATAILAAGVAGCGVGDSSESDGKVTLTLAYPSDPNAQAKLDALVREYQKSNPDVSVKYVFIPFTSWSEYITKVKTMVAGGDAPDLLRLAVEGIRQFVDDDLAMPFDDYAAQHGDYVTSLGLDQIHPNIQAPLQIDSKTYGYAFDWNNVVMHINTKLFEEAGVPLPAENWTKDDFLKAAQALTKTVDGQKQYGFMIPNDYFLTTAFLYGNNASVLNEDMTKATVNQPNAVEVVQFMHDLVYTHGVSPVPGPNVDAGRLFMAGKLAMYPAGRWPVASYQQNDFSDFDVQYLPTFQSQTAAFGSGTFPVLKTSEHPQEAQKFAMWLSASEYSQTNFLAVDSIPSRQDVMTSVTTAAPPANGGIFKESADSVKAIQAPVRYTDVSTIFVKALSEVYSNQKSAQEALDHAAKDINRALDS